LTAPPTEYNSDTDARFPTCKQDVRDQARCGSCWAFGAAEAFEDRYCRATGTPIRFSPQDLVSCEKDQFACDGGYLNKVWNFIQSTGIVADDCMPYTSDQGEVEECPKNDCSPSGKQKGGNFKKYKVKNAKGICSIFDATNKCQDKIKQDLYDNGPIEVGFTVYQDFMSYKSGVYIHTSGSQLGGHAVKLVGYGVDPQDGPYWLCQNSWAEKWGDKGYFKIGFGQCGIEGQAYAGTPIVD